MHIHLHVDSMKAAEELSVICKRFPEEIYLRSSEFCIDPKSTLGILAMMYSAKDQMYLDTAQMTEPHLSQLNEALTPFKLQ